MNALLTGDTVCTYVRTYLATLSYPVCDADKATGMVSTNLVDHDQGLYIGKEIKRSK